MASGTADLDEVVLKHSLGDGRAIYGVRDGQGGATVGFSYRYYVHEALNTDQAILAALVSAHPFLKTREPSVEVTQRNGVLHLSVGGRVYEYRSYALEGLGAVTLDMVL